MKEFKLKVCQYYSETPEIDVVAKFPESLKWFSNLDDKYSNYITVVDFNENWIDNLPFKCFSYSIGDKAILIYHGVNIDNTLPLMSEDEFYSLIDLDEYTIVDINTKSLSVQYVAKITDLTKSIGDAMYNIISISDIQGNESLGLSYQDFTDNLYGLIEGSPFMESYVKKVIKRELGDKIWSDALNLVTSKFTGDRFISSFNWRLNKDDKGDFNKIIDFLKQFENEK